MRSERIGEQITILKNVKELIRDGKLKVTDNLLGLLDRVGVNLQGYHKSVPAEIKSNKQMILKDVA